MVLCMNLVLCVELLFCYDCCVGQDENGLVYANLSSSFILSCRLNSKSSTAWYYNNIPLCDHGEQQDDCYFQENVFSNGSGNLMLTELMFKHAGWYTCAVATEEEGRKEKDFLLIVQGSSMMACLQCVSMKGLSHA